MTNDGSDSVPAGSPRVSIIIPTYKEAENIRALIGRIAAAMQACRGGYEVIIVDDDSRDGTKTVLEELSAAGLPVRLIIRSAQRGLSSAVLRGFDESRGGILVCMDADLSHPPETIPELVAALDDPRVHCCVASRYIQGGGTDLKWGWLRRLNSWAGRRLARVFTPISDPMSGFFAIPRRALDGAAPLRPVGYKMLLEIIVKCQMRNIREVPIHFAHRMYGRSKLGLRQKWDYIRHVARLVAFRCRGR